MKHLTYLLLASLLLASSCTSQKKLAYLNNLPPSGEQTFTMNIPEYRLQARDVISVTAKAMNSEGRIIEYLTATAQGGSLQETAGFIVNSEGNVIIPAVGTVKVAGLTMDETRKLMQSYVEKVFKNSTVECSLLSFRYTIIGLVKSPGTFVNYTDYLTIFEAIGHAGGLDDYGDRSKLFVIRTNNNETKTFRVNLQDKQILSSQVYFLLPNDIIIVQPRGQKIFSMNLPVISFILTTVSSALTIGLLLNSFLGK